ncbi:response regulator [Acetobacterium tundrae]|uniref:response regulator n=1 Tax=Acetobacterium tundrae TaxID=132932 RepID=UPI0028802D44|nr:response regulator [Acetobacterium tundrae]
MNWDCLIVDDEVELAKATCEYFEMFGITCTYVTTFEGYMDVVLTNTIKLILLDINLGKDSGFTLCKELRKKQTCPFCLSVPGKAMTMY